MALKRIPLRDKKTRRFSYITKKRNWIAHNFVGMNFLGPLFFEEGISEHQNKNLIGSRTRIESATIVYFPMFGNDIAKCPSEGMSTNPFCIFRMTFPHLIKKLQTSTNSWIYCIHP